MRSDKSKLPKREKTPGGSEIVTGLEADTVVYSEGSLKLIEAVTNHVEKYIGKVETVWHEKKSEYIHLDIHLVPADRKRRFTALVTSGMSELPMMVDNPIAKPFEFGELVVLMPSDFQLPQEGDMVGWPLVTMTYMARYPHMYRTWLAAGHTIVLDTVQWEGFACVLLGPSRVLPKEFHIMRPPETHFWSLFPIYQEEMDYKLEHGSDALFDLLDENKVTDLYEHRRKNVVTGERPKKN